MRTVIKEADFGFLTKKLQLQNTLFLNTCNIHKLYSFAKFEGNLPSGSILLYYVYYTLIYE